MNQRGTVADTVKRLLLWTSLTSKGFGRVEFESVLALRQVEDQLRRELAVREIPFYTLVLNWDDPPQEVALGLRDRLGKYAPGVISISGFHSGKAPLLLLAPVVQRLNLLRERLAVEGLRQIWWMTPLFADHFSRGAHDLDSWFQLHLHLTARPELPAEEPGPATLPVGTQDRIWMDPSLAAEVEVLSGLEPGAGAELLRWLGVRGRQSQLEDAAKTEHGHPLALRLLGSHLALWRRGDVRLWKINKDHWATTEIHEWLRPRIRQQQPWLTGTPEEQWLHLLGVLDLPIDEAAVEVLLAEPAIPGLTDQLCGLPRAALLEMQKRLQKDARLLVDSDSPGWLEAQPLLKQYFAQELRLEKPEAFRSAHQRLFAHYTQAAPDLPDTLEEMLPLYRAITHGCMAGFRQKALDEVYWRRIHRGSEGFSWLKLNASRADLEALAYFFEEPWLLPAKELRLEDQTWLLNAAAFCLRGLGILQDAIFPLEIGLESRVSAQDWRSAAGIAGNLSEVHLFQGEIERAVGLANQSVTFANRTRDSSQLLSRWATLADALHQAGRTEDAGPLFRQAELLESEIHPSFPYLHSLQGFQYCDLLLGTAERGAAGCLEAGANGVLACVDVEGRATWALELSESNRWLFYIALDQLTLGRTRLYRAILEERTNSESFSLALENVQQALEGLRYAGAENHVPRALLTRAWLLCHLGKPDDASRDLEEADEIAQLGAMRLHLADVALYRARLFHDSSALAEARRLIDVCGYGRRLPELTHLETILAPASR